VLTPNQHIFRQLATYGRLVTAQVAQRCRLLHKQAKSGLVTLVQLRLVQHHSSGSQTTYQADLTSAYNLLRTGKLAHFAQRQYGPVAGLVIEVLAAKGFTTAKDLESAVLQALEEIPGNDTRFQNGSKASAKVHDALKRLAEGGFISKVLPAHLLIPHDAREEAEATFDAVVAGGQKGESLRAARLDKVKLEMEKRLDSYVSASMIDTALSIPNGDSGAVVAQGELLLCVNTTPLVRSLRDDTASQHVSKTLGKAAARLAAAALKQIDLGVAPFEPSPNPRVDEQQLILGRLLDETQTPSHANGTYQKGGYGHGNDTNMTNGIDEEDDFIDQESLEEGLLMLAEGPYKFLRQDENTAWWYLDRYQLTAWLGEREILNLISARIGSVGMRLVRMLIDKGKLDEKLLQEMGLLSAKEMRQALAELQTLGLIELQEVPREPQRQPNRTIFLWFYDGIRARNLLLDQLYKSMARCYQRLQVVERDRLKATLEKIEREDVKDRVAEVVVGPEMVALQQFQAKERWLMGEIARLDDSVALLRDL
jgi:DNA-directed RNA polymerase III subunit RPC3